MLTWISRRLRLDDLNRRADLDERATVLALLARFVDEFASGTIIVLLPTLRSAAGLSVAQVGLALQVMDVASGIVEPAVGFAIDLWRRRPLLVLGAAGWGFALLVVGGLPTFAGALTAFALIGATSGALANTADVVLIEGHPFAEERVSTLSTIVDSVGALLAPLGVALLFRSGGSWRGLLLVTGVASVAYAVVLSRATFPAPPAASRGQDPPRLVASVADRVRGVLADGDGRAWLGVLVLDGIIEVAGSFEPVWLADVAGFSQSLVGLHLAVALGASLVGLFTLDRLLRRWEPVAILRVAVAVSLLAYPTWLLVGGTGAKFLLVVVRELAWAPIWPIARARALASVPGSAGTVGAILSVSALLPVPLLFGWAAQEVGFTTTMLVATVGALTAMLALVRDTRTAGSEPPG